MAIPVLAEQATGVISSGAVTSINISYDDFTTINAGDLLLVIAFNDHNSTTTQFDDSTNKPTGYTFINEAGSATSDVRIAAFWKEATGSESGNLSVPCASSQVLGAFMARITGADTSSPIDVTGADVDNGNAASHAITGITTVATNTLAVYCMAMDDKGGAPFSVSGGSWAENDEIASAGVDNLSASWGDQDMASAASTSDATVTCSATNGAAGFCFNIKEASGGSPYTITAEQGTYTVTGVEAFREISMSMEQGSVAVTGTDLTLSTSGSGGPGDGNPDPELYPDEFIIWHKRRLYQLRQRKR